MQALRTRAFGAARLARPSGRSIVGRRFYASEKKPENEHDNNGHKSEHDGGEHGHDHSEGGGDHGHDHSEGGGDHGHGGGDHHHNHHSHTAHGVEEGLGTAFYVFAGAVPASLLAYQITRPGADGAPSTFSTWLRQFDYFNDWEARNTIRTDLIEQAAHDKHLFLNAGRSTHVELKTPELLYSGSPWNVPAGHSANLDHVTEHYRKQALAEEERKVKKLLSSSS
ncbi:hypothetical protein F5Y17DRAFT_439697 [Xylariaceae sp. FL0594]|nr:hypothetical protein F5Y17DRAFT_439697 [Xylariaceae sp. FL0594]